jgi:hypothetical protein
MFTFLWRPFQDRRLVGRFRRSCAETGDVGQLAFQAGRRLGRWSLPGQHRMHGRDVSPGNLLIGSSGDAGWPAGDGALVGVALRILEGRHVRRLGGGACFHLAGLDLGAHQEANQFDGFLGMKLVSGNGQA